MTSVPDGGSDAAGPIDDADAPIVPQGLSVSIEPGFAGMLDLVGLTVRDGPSGLLIDAALKNDGDSLACSADLEVQLADTNDQPLADVINGLYTYHFYSYTPSGGSTTITGCAAPGDVTMTEIQAPGVTLAQVGSLIYLYHDWGLDAVLVDGLSVATVNAATSDAGVSYTGTVTNGFDTPLNDPQIAIFPLNRVGRPLGLATYTDTSQVPAGGTWTFQTNTAPATDAASYAAYPAGSLSN